MLGCSHPELLQLSEVGHVPDPRDAIVCEVKGHQVHLHHLQQYKHYQQVRTPLLLILYNTHIKHSHVSICLWQFLFLSTDNLSIHVCIYLFIYLGRKRPIPFRLTRLSSPCTSWIPLWLRYNSSRFTSCWRPSITVRRLLCRRNHSTEVHVANILFIYPSIYSMCICSLYFVQKHKVPCINFTSQIRGAAAEADTIGEQQLKWMQLGRRKLKQMQLRSSKLKQMQLGRSSV